MSAEEHKAKSVKTVKCFVVTVSDTRNVSTDQSGQLMKELLASEGHDVLGYYIVKDDPTEVENLLRHALLRDDLEAVLLTGGTGISPRDGTYEVVSRLLDKQISGFGEIFRFLSYQDIGSSAVMSRAQAGVAAGKVVISLPGSRGAVDLAMRRLVLPELGHMVSQVRGI
ncbi:MAG: molybdenum cofactor biosynthesis protein B [Candidatus Aerophobetes bacterium]